jgi:protein involved in temperature-dependent protein secretion
MPCDQQLNSSTCFCFTDSASAALAGQQQFLRQLLKYLDDITYAYGACAGADTTSNQGGRLGHPPATEMISQGVYAAMPVAAIQVYKAHSSSSSSSSVCYS